MELLNSVMQKLEPISDILYTGCRKPEVEIPPIPFPVNEVFENAVPIPFVDTFIYFINGMFGDANRCKLLPVKLSFD